MFIYKKLFLIIFKSLIGDNPLVEDCLSESKDKPVFYEWLTKNNPECLIQLKE